MHSSHLQPILWTFFTPPFLVYQRTHYTQDLHYNIPSDWVVRNSPLIYMDPDGWHKSITHFSSMCCSSPLNPRAIFYDGHSRHYDYRVLNILHSHHIQSFILKMCDYLNDQPNNNGPNLELNNLHGNARINFMNNHGNLKIVPIHINYVPVET